MSNSPQALIFDFDGTVADTMPLHFVAWSETVARYELEFPESRFYELGGVPTGDIIELLCAEQNKQLDVKKVAHEKELAFHRHIPQVQPIKEVLAIIDQYRGVLPMAVASGGIFDVVKKVIFHLNLDGTFAEVVTSEHVTRQKPNPDIFLEAAKRLGVEPKFCRAYEDTDIGIRAITAAGMEAIDVRVLRKQ